MVRMEVATGELENRLRNYIAAQLTENPDREPAGVLHFRPVYTRCWRGCQKDRRLGLYEGSLKYYSRALEVDKSLVAAWVGQVQMLIMLGEFPEAELWSRKALELFKNNAELMAARAQALCRTGDLKEAQAMCDAALGQQGISAYPWVTRGEVMVARKEEIDE